MPPAPDTLAWARSVLGEPDPRRPPVPLPGAGSDRRLTRLASRAGTAVLVENPCPLDRTNENDSFVYLAGHLRARRLPVPEIYGYQRALGCYLMEDLGDVDLLAEVRPGNDGARGSPGERTVPVRVAALYREALDVLVRFQTDGATGFDPARTHNPPRYDVALMREWESGYFVRELLVNHLAIAPPAGLDAELERLAARAAEAGAAWLLHRDYQSQNLKVQGDGIRIIDFQGARLGPPQYDLAALLLDPYADLAAPLRADLLAHYLDRFAARTGEERGRFLGLFPAVAAHRLMQALGAYAFLGRRRGKTAFLGHLPAALRLLDETLGELPAADVAFLRPTVRTALRRVAGED